MARYVLVRREELGKHISCEIIIRNVASFVPGKAMLRRNKRKKAEEARHEES